MKKAGSLLLIIVFTFMNAFSFIGCRQTEAAEEVRACWVCSVGNLDFPSRQGLGMMKSGFMNDMTVLSQQ